MPKQGRNGVAPLEDSGSDSSSASDASDTSDEDGEDNSGASDTDTLTPGRQNRVTGQVDRAMRRSPRIANQGGPRR